jgi:hypothetical protein
MASSCHPLTTIASTARIVVNRFKEQKACRGYISATTAPAGKETASYSMGWEDAGQPDDRA